MLTKAEPALSEKLKQLAENGSRSEKRKRFDEQLKTETDSLIFRTKFFLRKTWASSGELLAPQIKPEQKRESLLWTSVYVAMLVLMCVQTVHLYHEYRHQKPYLVVNIETQQETVFPTITVCNKM